MFTFDNYNIGGFTQSSQPRININDMGINVSSGGSWLDKVLGTFTSALAISKGVPYVPTSTIPNGLYNQGGAQYPYGQQQPYPQQYAYEQPASNTGGSIQQWIERNPWWILAGIAGVVLLMSPRPYSRNGIKRNGYKRRSKRRSKR